jgi:hypothetical protein
MMDNKQLKCIISLSINIAMRVAALVSSSGPLELAMAAGSFVP